MIFEVICSHVSVSKAGKHTRSQSHRSFNYFITLYIYDKKLYFNKFYYLWFIRFTVEFSQKTKQKIYCELSWCVSCVCVSSPRYSSNLFGLLPLIENKSIRYLSHSSRWKTRFGVILVIYYLLFVYLFIY